MSKLDVASSKVAIIGGGPAGMGCALWLKNMGLTPVIIDEGIKLGGQANTIERVNQWFLGHIDKPASQIVAEFSEHIQTKSIVHKLQYSLVNVNFLDSGLIEILLESATKQTENMVVNSLVIATGQSATNERVLMSIPGFREIHFAKKICYFPLDHLDMQDQLKGKRIIVLGGGDNAYCTALDLVNHATKIVLLMRSQPRAQSKFQSDLEIGIKQKSVELFTNTQIIRFNKKGSVLEIVVKQADGGQSIIIADWVFARLGFTPATAFLNEISSVKKLSLDAAGYIKIDPETRTSLPAIYAIGDVTNLQPASIINAVAHGAVAARTIESDLRKYH